MQLEGDQESTSQVHVVHHFADGFHKEWNLSCWSLPVCPPQLLERKVDEAKFNSDMKNIENMYDQSNNISLVDFLLIILTLFLYVMHINSRKNEGKKALKSLVIKMNKEYYANKGIRWDVQPVAYPYVQNKGFILSVDCSSTVLK